MNINDYQKEIGKFAQYPQSSAYYYPLGAINYTMIGLSNECGEALGKIKKVLRGDTSMAEQREALIDELGDVLWYLTRTATHLDISVEEIARRNYGKLTDRLERGTIKGSGDNR